MGLHRSKRNLDTDIYRMRCRYTNQLRTDIYLINAILLYIIPAKQGTPPGYDILEKQAFPVHLSLPRCVPWYPSCLMLGIFFFRSLVFLLSDITVVLPFGVSVICLHFFLFLFFSFVFIYLPNVFLCSTLYMAGLPACVGCACHTSIQFPIPWLK